MAESSGGSVWNCSHTAWQVCVGFMMLPGLKAQQSEALGRALCGTFVVRLQTAQKG